MSIYRRKPGQPENRGDGARSPMETGGRQPAVGLWRCWPAVVAALALFVSACGTASTTDASSQSSEADGGASVAAASDDQDGTAGTTDDTVDDTADEPADETEVAGTAEGEPGDESEPKTDVAAPAPNVPGVEVLDVADGSIVNLAYELAGEDRAILFWFWAPH